jgi:hypothetical protein
MADSDSNSNTDEPKNFEDIIEAAKRSVGDADYDIANFGENKKKQNRLLVKYHRITNTLFGD